MGSLINDFPDAGQEIELLAVFGKLDTAHRAALLRVAHAFAEKPVTDDDVIDAEDLLMLAQAARAVH